MDDNINAMDRRCENDGLTANKSSVPLKPSCVSVVSLIEILEPFSGTAAGGAGGLGYHP